MNLSLRHLTCSADGCAAQHYASGYCVLHYSRLRRRGTVHDLPWFDLEAWVRERLDPMPEECVLWDRTPPNKRGYGRYGKRLIHRYAYELMVGPIPDGLTIDHLCMVKLCFNPRHLEPVTKAENHRRWVESIAATCMKGHPATPENTYRGKSTGKRDCRVCRRDRRRARRAAGVPHDVA